MEGRTFLAARPHSGAETALPRPIISTFVASILWLIAAVLLRSPCVHAPASREKGGRVRSEIKKYKVACTRHGHALVCLAAALPSIHCLPVASLLHLIFSVVLIYFDVCVFRVIFMSSGLSIYCKIQILFLCSVKCDVIAASWFGWRAQGSMVSQPRYQEQ